MSNKKTHVYFVPGMAAGKEIFRNINLPKADYEIHILEWLIPTKNETLPEYAKRMAHLVTEPEAVLVGVSFGGVVVQEMSPFIKLKKLIIVSSVKSREEIPRRLKLANKTLAYKLVPTGLVANVSDLTKFSIGPKSEKRLKLYQEYLHVRDKRYLDWAIEKMVGWDRKDKDSSVIHIHGNADAVFPMKNIDNCIKIEGGTHIMLLTKGKEISDKIVSVIQNN